MSKKNMGTRIDDFLKRRAEIMTWYHSAIVSSENVRLNRVKNWARAASVSKRRPVSWICMVRRCEASKPGSMESRWRMLPSSRPALIRRTKAKAISTTTKIRRVV